MELCGDANDYVGKGLSGGKICIYPPQTCSFKTDDSIIVRSFYRCFISISYQQLMKTQVIKVNTELKIILF